MNLINLEPISANKNLVLSLGVLVTIFLLGTSSAFAVDGVTEIGQARANAGLITPTDTPGFPVTIGQSGAYKLTSNLLTPVVGDNAIEITVDNVDLDLNGFMIDGFNNGAVGILSSNANITVRNGIIRRMTGDAIDVGVGARIEDVTATDNGGDGIDVGNQSSVDGSSSRDNGGVGIRGTLGSSIIGNQVHGNVSDGIGVGAGSTVLKNTVRDNQGDGIQIGVGCTVSHNTIHINDGAGVAGALSVGSTFIGNSVRSNGLVGLAMSAGTGYAHNVVAFNNGAGNNAQVTGGVPLDDNLCVTNLINRICP